MMTIEIIIAYASAILPIPLMILGLVALYKFIKCCNKYLDKD